MADTNCSLSLSNLIYNDEEDKELLIVTEDHESYIETLVTRESKFESRLNRFSEAESLSRCTRLNYIRWVLKMKDCFGFRYQTAYLAISYFDRFLVHRTIDEGKIWAMKLLSVACLSLAAKMEEIRPPALSEYELEEYQFRSNVIQRMELLVLNTLEWRMRSVTPFSYMCYFASKFECKIGRKDLDFRAIGFIFEAVEAINLANCRPSTIAAAAILAASSDRLTKTFVDAKMSRISLPEPLESENVYSCYYVMIQKSQKQKLKPLQFPPNSIELNRPTSFTTATNKKRRLQ